MFFKRKNKVRQAAEISAFDEQTAKIADLKKALLESNAQLLKSTSEAKELIAEVSTKFKRSLKKLDQELGVFVTSRNEGVLFVDYRGEIIHANNAAAELLNRQLPQLMHRRIDFILTGVRQRKFSFEECSKLIISKATEDCTYDDLCDTAKTAYVLKTKDVAMKLDEPVVIVMKAGEQLHPLKVTMSLINTSPREVTDITYICKISELAKVPEHAVMLKVAA